MRVDVMNYNRQLTLDYRVLAIIIALIIASNVFTYYLIHNKTFSSNALTTKAKAPPSQLYLMDKASAYVYDVPSFEKKVNKVSRKLSIPPEWLMAVMHSESKFDASFTNPKGSGATGLIQWMPKTAKDFNVTVTKIRNMSHIEQMDFVYKYLDQQRKNHDVEFQSLTDVYLAILYPKALSEDYCYTLYAQPSTAYRMNIGLDQDKDGRVTVQDIDKYLKRKYATAYMSDKKEAESLYAKMLGAFSVSMKSLQTVKHK